MTRNATEVIAAAAIGLLFGLGIAISGMGNPAKVLNFFDVAGHWDPSLAFVMGGALMVTAIGYRFVLARPKPVLAPQFHLPRATLIDTPLIAGSAVFGIGWGVTGFCPGGAIPMLGSGRVQPLLFFVGFIGGIAIARMVREQISAPGAPPSSASIR